MIVSLRQAAVKNSTDKRFFYHSDGLCGNLYVKESRFLRLYPFSASADTTPWFIDEGQENGI